MTWAVPYTLFKTVTSMPFNNINCFLKMLNYWIKCIHNEGPTVGTWWSWDSNH